MDNYLCDPETQHRGTCPGCRRNPRTEAPSSSASELADLVPTSWLDPLLTGPDKALTGEAGKWGCPDIENLMRAIKKRIEDA